MENQDINYTNLIKNIMFSEKLSKIDVLGKFLQGSFIYYYNEKNKNNGQNVSFKEEELDIFKEKFEEYCNIIKETIDLFEQEVNLNKK